MNKFTSICESEGNKKYFTIKAEISISVEAESEGEASYISDLNLASVKGQSGYTITNISEITKEEYKNIILEKKR